LDGPLSIDVRLETDRGTVVNFVAILFAEPGLFPDSTSADREMVTRWDCAHGVVHRDVYGRNNAFIKKDFRPTMSKELGVPYAIHDLKQNASRYYEFFATH